MNSSMSICLARESSDFGPRFINNNQSKYMTPLLQKIYATPFEFMEANDKPTANSKKIYAQQSTEPPYFYTKAGIIKYSGKSYPIKTK